MYLHSVPTSCQCILSLQPFTLSFPIMLSLYPFSVSRPCTLSLNYDPVPKTFPILYSIPTSRSILSMSPIPEYFSFTLFLYLSLCSVHASCSASCPCDLSLYAVRASFQCIPCTLSLNSVPVPITCPYILSFSYPGILSKYPIPGYFSCILSLYP
jgi:hypothetical protein